VPSGFWECWSSSSLWERLTCGDRVCWSFLMVLVCQSARSATRRSETTPKGSYPPIRFRVEHAEDGLSAFGCEASQDVVEP